jgi:hypothetical protein
LKAKLQRFVKHVLNFHDMVNEKTAFWLSVPNHFQWRFEQPLLNYKMKTIVLKNLSQIDAVGGFLNDTPDLLLLVGAGIAIQKCQLFHSLQGKPVTKDCTLRES